jgi:hypothetical protein
MNILVSWISAGNCQLGWLAGAAAGTFADVVILILIATAPKLGPKRASGLPKRRAPRRVLYGLLGIPAIWIAGGLYVGRELFSCYASMLAIASALTIGVVLLLGMMTAANQIGARSVR